MGVVVSGPEAVAAGTLTEYELKKWYRPIFRGVYVPKGIQPTLCDRTMGAWLSSKPQGVIAGMAASALLSRGWKP